MSDYIVIQGQKIELTQELVEEIQKKICPPEKQTPLAEIAEGETFKIGGYEFIVLEQTGDTTAVILKELYGEETQFGENNNFSGSTVDGVCKKFADELAKLIGSDALIEHEVDLTADDGLKDYGTVNRRVSLLTAQQYREHVYKLDKHKLDAWWWLATPFSTKAHGIEYAVKCVAPSGYVSGNHYYNDSIGFRPFCILKSTIFVSK